MVGTAGHPERSRGTPSQVASRVLRLRSASLRTTELHVRLHRIPDLVQLFETYVSQLLAPSVQLVFHFVETRDELVGRRLQGRLRVKVAFAREIDHGKE